MGVGVGRKDTNRIKKMLRRMAGAKKIEQARTDCRSPHRPRARSPLYASGDP